MLQCVRSGKWPAVPTVNEKLTRTLLEEEANRASAVKEGVDPATLQRLADAWHDFAVPCPTKPKITGGIFHACECKHGEHERWCVVGADAFTTWLGMTDNALAKAVHRRAVSLGRNAYIDPQTGFSVFTAHYLKRRPCCGNGCRHCPWRHANVGRKDDKLARPAESAGAIDW